MRQAILFLTVITLFTVSTLGQSSTAPGAISKSPTNAVSSKKAGAEITSPTSLELGEVIRGSLVNSEKMETYHYWLVDLPAGKYKCVVDLGTNDGQEVAYVVDLQFYSQTGEKVGPLGTVIEAADKYRKIFQFNLKKPLRSVVRVDNKGEKPVNYWMGFFPINAEIVSPFFANGPKITTLKIGETGNALVEGYVDHKRNLPSDGDAYFKLSLPAGEYKVTAEIVRVDGKNSNVGGAVTVYGADGDEQIRALIGMNEISPSSKASNKLSLAEDVTAIIRIRSNIEKTRVSLLVEKLQ